MVLFKRKPVAFLPRPSIDDDNLEVWMIPETDEVFVSYESYLQRMDWYKQRKFICEISGHSALSFFDALKSEKAGARDVESAFPEALKQPVLRKLQFSTVSRIDNLVDQVYDAFKTDYYPGEQVIVTKGNERHNGTIRDKATFSEARDADTGVLIREAFARYIVQIDETDAGETEILAEDVDITRDRKIFTKQMLRSFIKNTVTRESWTGAPWLVKPDVARIYHVDTNVPLHLQHSHKIAEKKERKKAEQQQQQQQQQLLQQQQQGQDVSGTWPATRLPELKPASKGSRKQAAQSLDQITIDKDTLEQWSRTTGIDPLQLHVQLQHWYSQQPPTTAQQKNGQHDLLPLPPWLCANGDASMLPFPLPPHLQGKGVPKVSQPAPPPIKYPIEDMDCAPKADAIPRPTLKFLSKQQTAADAGLDDIVPGLQEDKISCLLEAWNTLNVYCQVLVIDSFTFDDFVDAMQWTSTEIECELLLEIHCAMLKQLVHDEKSGGAIQIPLPDLPEPEDSEDDEDQEESRITSPSPEPDVPARRTRSSLNRKALAELEKENSRIASETVEQIPHRAAEVFSEDDTWIARLQKRDFHNGGWQLILVGLLHQLAARPRLNDSCTRILSHLVPLDADPTAETVTFQYSTMDINLRIEALQILCAIFLDTKAVKKFLEEMAATMTEYRKKKIEHQRRRKEAITVLKKLHDERKILAPLERSPSPVAELEELEEEASKMIDVEMTEVVDSEGEVPVTTRSLRRGQDRAAERKRKRDEEAERRKKEQEEKASKGSKEYQKVLKAIEKERKVISEEEEQIDTIDGDLREADAYRTRCLGKDRFCNRYWWFERNAMPYAGLPSSSTADADYANGRLWVQGPDEMERVGYIDVPEEARNNYFRCFQVTPADRKLREEGPTNLHHATQWGFYDSEEAIDKLIEWLDSRGHRELKLKKELVLQRDIMVRHMINRQKYIHPEKETNGTHADDDGELEDEKAVPPPTRMSTRTKTYHNQQEDLEKAHRCLRWKNSMALAENKHRHYDPPPSHNAKKGKATVKRPSGLSEVVNANAPRASRTSAGGHKDEVFSRSGRATTRHGSRYNN